MSSLISTSAPSSSAAACASASIPMRSSDRMIARSPSIRHSLREMRFPCVRNQHDHNDCGPAVIATVAKYHGLDLSLGRVREACKTDAIGTNLYGLMVAAESLGFDSKAARVQTGVDPWPVLKKCPPPFIVHVVVPMPGLATTNEMMGHFWVVFKISDKHVDIADPAQGLRRVTK